MWSQTKFLADGIFTNVVTNYLLPIILQVFQFSSNINLKEYELHCVAVTKGYTFDIEFLCFSPIVPQSKTVGALNLFRSDFYPQNVSI